MKKIILILINVMCATARAQLKNESAFNCLGSLSAHMTEQAYEIPNRSTIMYMFKEGWGAGMYSSEIRTGALLIERNEIRVCSFPWSINEPVTFVAKDGAGIIRYSYEYGKATPFREINRVQGLSANEPDCKVVTNSTDTQNMLKKIIMTALKKDIQSQGAVGYKLSTVCEDAGIKAFDVKTIVDELQKGKVDEAAIIPRKVGI